MSFSQHRLNSTLWIVIAHYVCSQTYLDLGLLGVYGDLDITMCAGPRLLVISQDLSTIIRLMKIGRDGASRAGTSFADM
jgi:hypothetical protein